MSIKYYHLAKDEELPDEFCAVRDVGGEPSEYVFYVPEAENAKLREQGERLFDKTLELGTENAELREELAKARDPQRIGGQADPSRLVKDIDEVADPFLWEFIGRRMRELGIEVE